MKNTPETNSAQIGSLDDAAARNAKRLLAPPMKTAMRTLNPPGNGASLATTTVPCFNPSSLLIIYGST
ncbi:MAG: hypothetical protein V9H26_03310 [Verrucomicrobiota bacterium]